MKKITKLLLPLLTIASSLMVTTGCTDENNNSNGNGSNQVFYTMEEALEPDILPITDYVENPDSSTRKLADAMSDHETIDRAWLSQADGYGFYIVASKDVFLYDFSLSLVTPFDDIGYIHTVWKNKNEQNTKGFINFKIGEKNYTQKSLGYNSEEVINLSGDFYYGTSLSDVSEYRGIHLMKGQKIAFWIYLAHAGLGNSGEIDPAISSNRCGIFNFKLTIANVNMPKRS